MYALYLCALNEAEPTYAGSVPLAYQSLSRLTLTELTNATTLLWQHVQEPHDEQNDVLQTA